MAPTPVWRPTARVLVADPDGRVLLFSAGEEHEGTWWFTPGGGVHRGETLAAAAVRELAEETGYACTEAELGPVVATSVGRWRSAEGTLFLGAHSFFFLRVRQQRLDTGRQEALERSLITGHRWWPAADLWTAIDRVWPAGLGGLLDGLLCGDVPARPVRLSQG